MKKIYVVMLFCISVMGIHAQVNINAPWTWVNGYKHLPMWPVNGTKGVTTPENSPGGRKQAVRWQDQNGKIWVFGGYGYGGNSNGYLNDLWKYDPVTNEWTWINGDNTVNVLGVYGTQGVAAATNKPGSRRGSISWTDDNGNFYLFGGHGYSASAFGRLNDMWKYDPQIDQWTWLGGSNAVNAAGAYGSLQVAAPGNWPGGRNGATGVKDNNNNVWLFGGDGYGATGVGRLNDIWKYNMVTNQWTWMKGQTTVNSPTSGGTPYSYTPGGRAAGNMGWVDNAGNFYVFGGNSYSSIPNNPYYVPYWEFELNNELWKFNATTMLWSQLATGAVSKPDPREYGISWTDAAGNLWLFGGHNTANGAAEINDLWKFTVGTGQWTRVRAGITAYSDYGNYGTPGIPRASNRHGGRASGISWMDASGKLWSFGGEFFEGINISFRNDVWVYDPATDMQTLMRGDTSLTLKSYRGNPGDPLNRPGERLNSASWSDNNGNLWMFGGDSRVFGSGSGYNLLGDFWKYNIATDQWTTINIPPAGGPGPRDQAMTWTDAAGNLWIFGGGAGVNGSYDDMWRYNPGANQWTLLRGTNGSLNFQGTTYGTVGVPAAGNYPAARRPSASWIDNAGNLWFFGGEFNGGGVRHNDLWRFNPSTSQYTWMGGDNTANQPGSYGTMGVASATNKPGSRGYSSAAWKDNAGNLWLFGGVVPSPNGLQYYTFLNDLWKYDIVSNQWTWMSGGNTVNNAGVFGTKGIPDAANKPGARTAAVSWTDNNGNFWLMNGKGVDAAGTYGYLNDLWMYNPSTNQWAWVKGDSLINNNGIYGTKGIPNIANKPGSRYGAVGWKDGAGSFWLYGGAGYAEAGSDRLSDLWKISPALSAPLPVRLLEFKGRLVNDNSVLNWKTENESNLSGYIVERSTDRKNYVAVGIVAAININGTHQYNFSDPGIASLGASVVYYRLKQKDIDGKSTYSNIIALTIDKSLLVMLYPNPVIKTANVTITISRAETVNVKVINGAGAVVKQLQWKLASGSTSETLDLSVLAKGTYYLDISGETISKRIPFVRQ